MWLGAQQARKGHARELVLAFLMAEQPFRPQNPRLWMGSGWRTASA